MFHKILSIDTLPNLQLSVRFLDGTTKIYDIRQLIDKIPAFAALKDKAFFSEAAVDVGGYGVVWNDDLDLSCDELWEHGMIVETPFDGLMSFADASGLWGLSESTLRKAVSYGKIVSGIDARKFGKQWIVSIDAMKREYGEPLSLPRMGQ